MELVSKPFHSPHVLELLEWFAIPNFTVLILERPSPCMDLLDFCELYGGKLPEPLAQDIMRQVVKAARHCCDQGVFHNDIKPENILINIETMQVKLIDFGCGDLLQDTPYEYCPGKYMSDMGQNDGERSWRTSLVTVLLYGCCSLFYIQGPQIITLQNGTDKDNIWAVLPPSGPWA